jgi:hypothetical protein
MGSSGVGSIGHQNIGEVDAAGFHVDEDLPFFGLRAWDILDLEDLRSAAARDDECFHGGENLTQRYGGTEREWKERA